MSVDESQDELGPVEISSRENWELMGQKMVINKYSACGSRAPAFTNESRRRQHEKNREAVIS